MSRRVLKQGPFLPIIIVVVLLVAASVLHAAWKIDQVGAKAARKDISLIKFVVANTMQQVIDRALQVHGGLGMTDDTIIAFFYRHERAARIYDGADEVHKVSAARQILKGYESKKVH